MACTEPFQLTNLSRAAEDYRFLMNRGYPENPALKLVGDRYQLPRTARMVLYRGVASAAADRRRREKLLRVDGGEGLPGLPGRLGVDGYNVLYTLANYLLGRPVFLCSDGLLRDAGACFARPGETGRAVLARAEALLTDQLGRGEGVTLFLDQQVSRSGELAGRLRQACPEAEVVCVRDTDRRLKAFEGVRATSDSVVVEEGGGPVLDLAREILEGAYGPEFPEVCRPDGFNDGWLGWQGG